MCLWGTDVACALGSDVGTGRLGCCAFLFSDSLLGYSAGTANCTQLSVQSDNYDTRVHP